ncbi:MAG: hypothetical protein HQK76_18810 [Desulfobacterales bacterium]|nr:hypothetical protein [Desulfobacterales bacterium]
MAKKMNPFKISPEFKQLEIFIQESVHNAASDITSKNWENILKAYNEVIELIDKNKSILPENAFNNEIDAFISFKEDAEKFISLANKKFYEAKRLGLSSRAWKLCIEALTISPGLSEAKELMMKIQNSLCIKAKCLLTEFSYIRAKWFPKASLIIARDSGDVPLSLKTLSPFPNHVEFLFKNKTAYVIDHNTEHGIFFRLTKDEPYDFAIQNITYKKIPANEAFCLPRQGEILIGLICSISFRVTSCGIIINFLIPYDPKYIKQIETMELSSLWPNSQGFTDDIIAVGDNYIIVGDHPESVFSHEKFGSSAIKLIKKDDFFTVYSGGSLAIEEFFADNLPLMNGMNYKIKNVPIFFKGLK